MKITTKKTIEEQVEITLPAYYKSKTGYFHYKIYSEENCLCVYENEIGIKHASLPFNIESVQSTKEEFLEGYIRALSNISNKLI
jgi:hypothetical protein